MKKAEPRDLRLMSDSLCPAAGAAFLVAPSFLAAAPLAASVSLPGPAGLMATGSGSWCSPNAPGTRHPVRQS